MDSPLVLARGGGVLGARFDDGLGFKACESWVSSTGTGTDSLSCLSPSSPPRICLIVGTNHEEYIYNLNLGGDTVDEPRPNLRITHSFRDFRFCVVDSTLYALKTRSNWKYNPAADHDDVYTLRLSDNFSDVVLYDKMLQKLPVLLSPKEAALPLPVGECVLFFSTVIRFHSKLHPSIRKHTCDFELYDPIHNVVTKLPQLWIRPEDRSRFCTTFQLFRPHSHSTLEWEDFPIFNSHSHSTPLPVYFTIRAYAFHGTLFLIQTNFDRLFSIDHFHPQAQWRLMDKDMKLRGRGRGRDRNFITLDGQLCVDAFGVHRFQGGNSRSTVEFPLSYFPSVSRSVTLLDSCTPCIVRATIDPSCYEDCYEYSTTTCWCVDVLKVDFPNLLAQVDADDTDKDGGIEKKKEYVSNTNFCIIKDGQIENKSEYINKTVSFKFCIKDKKAHSIYDKTVSFKFCIKDKKAHSIYVVGVFPF